MKFQRLLKVLPFSRCLTLCRLRKFYQSITFPVTIPTDDVPQPSGHKAPKLFLQRAPSNHSHGLWLIGSFFWEPIAHSFLPFLVEAFHKNEKLLTVAFVLSKAMDSTVTAFRCCCCNPDSVLWLRGERLHIPLHLGANRTPVYFSRKRKQDRVMYTPDSGSK